MRYIGLALLVLAVCLVCSLYRSLSASRVRVLEEFVRLVKHASSRVSAYFEPPSAWASGWRSECDGVEEFLSLVRGGAATSEAFSSVADGLSLSAEAKGRLSSLFSELGRGTVAAEGQEIDRAVRELGVLLERERSESEERVRISAVMALMLSVGFAILII